VLSVPPANGHGRSSALDVLSYEVVLDLTQGTDTFWSRTRVHFRCQRDGAAAFADLHAVSIRQVALNGTHLGTGGLHDGRLELPRLASDNTLAVEAEFAWAPAGEGLHRVTGPADASACVYSKTYPAGAARVFCCFDRPDLRAPFTVSVRAPAGWSSLGNTPVVARPAGGKAGLWRFAPTTPLAPSLFSVCAGPFCGPALACARDQGQSLPVAIRALPPAAALLEPGAVLELVRQPLRYYERTLGVPYPYGKYDLVFVPQFPALAFSAPGLVTVQDQVLQAREGTPPYYLAAVIAHELAHAWFGGLASMRHRDDTWLVEAITTYLSRTALENILPGTTPWAESTSPTLPDHSYAGDAAAIRQLETLIGRQAIILGLGSLLRRHAHSTATKDDLIRGWSQASGRDLRTWAAKTLIPARRREDHATG
jgi:aminopeptidase N